MLSANYPFFFENIRTNLLLIPYIKKYLPVNKVKNSSWMSGPINAFNHVFLDYEVLFWQSTANYCPKFTSRTPAIPVISHFSKICKSTDHPFCAFRSFIFNHFCAHWCSPYLPINGRQAARPPGRQVGVLRRGAPRRRRANRTEPN